MKVLDLTHELTNDIVVYPGAPQPVIEQAFSVEKDGYHEMSLTFTTHIGTHLDTPKHMIVGARGLSDYEVGDFCGKAKCVRIDEIEETDLEGIDYLLFYTGWDRYWNSDEYFKDFPIMSERAVEKIANSDLKGIGMDVISVDPVTSVDFGVHHALLKKDKIIVENLRGLEELVGEEFTFTCFPLKFEGEGCPVRATAIL